MEENKSALQKTILELESKIKTLEKENQKLLDQQNLIQTNADILVWGTNAALWSWDYKTGKVDFSDKKALMLGYNPEELDADVYAFTKLIHPDDYDNAMENMRRHLEGKTESYEIEYRIKAKDGSYKWFFDKGKVIERDQNRKPLKIVGIVNDISVRKENLLQLKESERKYRLISKNTSEGILIFDANSIMQYASDSYLNQLGYKLIEEIGRDADAIYDLVHPDDKDELFSLIYNAIDEKKEELRYEYRIKHKNGKYIWREDNAKFNYDINGKHIDTYVVCRDITERKLREEKIRKLEKAVESSNACIVITDFDGNIEYVNNYFTQVTGYLKEEAIGKNPRILKAEYHDEKYYKKLWETITKGESWEGEFCNKKKNGELYWENAIISPIADINDKITHFVAIKNDITEQKNIEIELEKRQLLLQLSANINMKLLLSENINEVIQNVLKEIGDTTKRDRVYIFDFHNDKVTNEILSTQLFEYVQPGIKAEIDNPELQNLDVQKTLPRWYAKFKSGKIIRGNVSSFPDSERILLESQDIISIIVFPIIFDNHLWGFIGLDNCKTKDDWSDSEVSILMSTASALGMALIRDERNKELVRLKEHAEENFLKTQSLLEANPDLMFLFSKEGLLLDYHAHDKSQLYDQPEKFLNQTLDSVLPSELAKLTKEKIRNVLQTQQLEIYTYNLTINNEIRTFESRMTYVDKTKALAIVRDITDNINLINELKIAKHKAENSEYKVRSMFDNSLTGFLYFTTEGKIMEANPAILKILGSPSLEESLKVNVLNFQPLIEIGFAGDVLKCISSKNVIKNEVFYKSKWGKEVYMTYFLIPIITGNEVQGIWANLHDLTDLWHTQNELIKAREKAEESNRLKTAFLNNMSHEVRTPLNAISGFSQLLTNPNLSKDKIEKYNKLIQQSTVKLIDIISDVIEISQLQSNQIQLLEIEFNLYDLVQEILEYYHEIAVAKDLNFIYNLNIECKVFKYYSDRNKISKIIKHLIDNAIKFTEKGEVKIECSISKNKFVFEVIDTGIGIPKKIQKYIFEPFTQKEIHDTKNYGGNGVGLAIVKGYTNILNGTISIHSELNTGTLVKLEIPLKEKGRKTEIAEDESIHFKIETLLIVEDEKNNQDYLKELSSEFAPNIIFANNGKEAVEICSKNSKIDLILMDIKMPVMDGYEATKRIREIIPNVPIIAQTAYALDIDIKKLKEFGFKDYISKPITIMNFNKTIKRVIDK